MDMNRRFLAGLVVLTGVFSANQTQAVPQPLSFTATADNAYAIYAGTGTSAVQIVGSHANLSAGDIFYSESYTTTAQDTDWIYVAAWGDENVQQFLLTDVINSATGVTIPSGDARWQVTATGINLGLGSAAPTLAEITTQIGLANASNNPSGGWKSITASALTNGQANPPYPGISGPSRLMWWNSGKQAGAEAPFKPGFNHDEYLIFRLPVNTPRFGLYNSGVDANRQSLPAGSSDPHYKITINPDTNFPPIQQGIVTNGNSGWIASGTGSMWIAPQADQSNYTAATGGLNGYYEYQTTFDLNGSDATTAVITGQWATDNSGVSISLNGSQIGTFTTPTASFDWHPFSFGPGQPVSVNFLPGLNTLVFRVYNNAASFSSFTPTGLRVEISGIDGAPGDADIPTLPEWAAIIMALLMMGLAIKVQARNRA